MIVAFNTIVFFWWVAWTIFAARKLASGVRSSVLFLIVVHFILFGIPLLLDITVGSPEYTSAPGYRLATADIVTSALYNLYAACVPPIVWRWGMPSDTVLQSAGKRLLPRSIEKLKSFQSIYFAFLWAPVIAWSLSPDPTFYRYYGAVISGQDIDGYHHIVALTCKLALVAFAGLLYSSRRLMLSFILALPLVGVALWLDGKRNSVVILFLLVFVVLWLRGKLHGKKLAAAALVSLALIMSFSYGYQRLVRGLFSQGASRYISVYESARIEYGRDHGMKLAIYAELYPEVVQILEHRGQSVLFHLTMFVPRTLWPEKPLPYAQYATSAMFLQSARDWGWSMTTSWGEEAIANFGWLGMLIAPFSLAFLCRLGDTSESDFGPALTAAVASLFLCVQLTAFAPIFLIWVVVTVHGHLARRRNRKITAPPVFIAPAKMLQPIWWR